MKIKFRCLEREGFYLLKAYTFFENGMPRNSFIAAKLTPH